MKKYAWCLALWNLKKLKNSNSTNTKGYIYDLGWKFELVLMPKFNFYADKIWGRYSSFFLFQTTLWESLQCWFNLYSTQCLFFFTPLDQFIMSGNCQSPTQPLFQGWRKSEHNEKRDEKWQMHTIYRFHMRNQTLDTWQIFKLLTLIFFNLSTAAGTLQLQTNEPPPESGCDTSTFSHLFQQHTSYSPPSHQWHPCLSQSQWKSLPAHLPFPDYPFSQPD